METLQMLFEKRLVLCSAFHNEEPLKLFQIEIAVV